MPGPVSELTFRRTMINLTDAGRLGEGEDLNDALLDFFVKLGQALIPKGGDAEVPVSYLGAHFFKQLRSAAVGSGEEGWKNVQNWAKRKTGGLFKGQYGAFSVPINEDLKDDKGKDAGNHWWLALVINPPGGATLEPTAVMCLDSMQRRKKQFAPPKTSSVEGSLNKYTLEVSEVEQAGYLVIITFDARGDGAFGALPRPEASKLHVDGYVCKNPTLGLRINMQGGDNVPGRFEGTLTFALDGRCRSSTFKLEYGEGGYTPLQLEFDPFSLTKLQKDVSRFIGGYLAKEWMVNGPKKEMRFEKQSARALVADVHQQENLNDCGVFVLENTLRSLAMKRDFLKGMAEASPQVLKNFPWPSQTEITNRKAKLRSIVARLFAAAADKGTADVEVLIKGDQDLRKEVLQSLTDEKGGELDTWSGQLQKELAARQIDKDKVTEEQKKKDEAIQARRDEEKARREAEERRLAEEKREGKWPPAKPRGGSSSDSDSGDRRKKPAKRDAKDAKGKAKRTKKRKGSSSASRSSDESSGGRGRKRKPPPKGGKRKKDVSSSRSRSPSSSPDRRKKRR